MYDFERLTPMFFVPEKEAPTAPVDLTGIMAQITDVKNAVSILDGRAVTIHSSVLENGSKLDGIITTISTISANTLGVLRRMRNRHKIVPADGVELIYEDDGMRILQANNLYDADGNIARKTSDIVESRPR